MKNNLNYLSISLALGLAGTAHASYVLLDDFESYTAGSYGGGSTAFTANGGPWESNTNGSTSLVGIADDAGNQYVDFGWAAGQRGVQTTVTTAAQGDSATYYWQLRSAGATNTDFSSGLSYRGFDNTFAFGDFEVQITFIDDNAGALHLGARDGATTNTTLVTGLSFDTWYDIWVVVDNATDTFDAYWGTSGDPNALGTLFADDYTFRNSATGTQSSDLVTFATLSNNQSPDRTGQVDNLYFNTEAVPEPSIALLGGLGMLGLIRRRR